MLQKRRQTTASALLGALLVLGIFPRHGRSEQHDRPDTPTSWYVTDALVFATGDDQPPVVHPVSLQDPLPPVWLFPALQPETSWRIGTRFERAAPSWMTRSRASEFARALQKTRPGTDVVSGAEAILDQARYSGSLADSITALRQKAQKRSPAVTDNKTGESRTGSGAATNSHWIPARIDLDTMLSKIDSRLVRDIIIVGGPYSARHGPGFRFLDVDLLGSPRFVDGLQWHGSTAFDYRANGEQWHGRQTLLGGGPDWGVRFGYGHRTGNDYRSGDGTQIAASYNSRAFDVALGCDLPSERQVEFTYLRVDQTGVELPGQAFDIDYLVTDGFDIEYVQEEQSFCDLLEVELWYNRTRLEGNAQSPSKRATFPGLAMVGFEASTDVDSMSTGFRAATTWSCPECWQLTTGADLRFVKQELNELASLPPFSNRNSPIPRSYSANPGVFAELSGSALVDTIVTLGARLDSVSTAVQEEPMGLIGFSFSDYRQVLGASDFSQHFMLGQGFLTAEHALGNCWTATAGLGYAERAPNLTELYAAGPFMFLLQNGLNTITGDPSLQKERLYQLDLGLRFDGSVARFGLRGFYSWLEDYITYENMRIATLPGPTRQVNLKYVNTDLATIAGAELYAEYDAAAWLVAFATLSYTEGRDHTRDGNFATVPAMLGMASRPDPTRSRGAESGVGGGAEEPLPGIYPLVSVIGMRLRDPAEQSRWTVELSGRIVDNQDRVAESLLESATAGFTVWNLRGLWQADDQLLLVAGVENLADNNYREHFDFLAPDGTALFQPGVTFYVGAERTY